ncbi:MAG: hypothetical protein ACRDQ1_16025, partial [Sciscionella sp.]
MNTAGRAPRLRTVSLRRRVILASLSVLTLVLVVVVAVVLALFAVQTHRAVSTVLTDRVQLARQLAARDVAPLALIRRVDTRSVRARLTLR